MYENMPMLWSEKGFKPFRLEVLTPVFIGSGDIVSPLEYVLGGDGDDHLYHIDIDAFMSATASDKEVQDIVNTGSLPRIRRMMQEKVDPSKFSKAKTEIDPKLKQRLLASLKDDRSNKGNEIASFIRNPLTGEPFLPGSSLKGALSTPIIDLLDQPAGGLKAECAKAFKPQDKNRAYRGWMDRQFGRISEHAMKALKVSDCPADPGAIRIFRAQEVSKTPGKQGTPKPPAEALRQGAELWGRLFMASQQGRCQILLRSGRGIDFPLLRKICNAFYRKRYEMEKKKFYSLPHFKDTRAQLEAVDRKIQEALDGADSALLLRIGHYSHVECVTVESSAPKTRKAKDGSFMPFGTTRTLADSLLPFGWVLLHPCDEDEYFANTLQKEDAAHAVWERKCMAFLEARQNERNAEEKRLKVEEARLAAEMACKEAEAAEKARIASLPEEERIELELRSGKMDENATMAVFARLDAWDEPVRRRLAQALKEAWTAMGKWNGKQSKKQVLKIEKVKATLA